MKLSVCMIAHNEEAKIHRALQSVRFADELIVVDCESSDRTAQIARKAGARVFSHPNIANLNVNKNYSFDQATCDFILCLDADEMIPEDCAAEIRSVIEKNPSQNGFYLPRRNYYFGKWLKYGGHYPDHQLRLFRRGRARFPQRHVHEKLQVKGRIGKLRRPFDHFPYDTREEAAEKLDFYTDFEAHYLLERGEKPSPIASLRYLIWLPAMRFVRRFIFQMGFLDGSAGWQAALMDIRNFQMRYRKLRRLVTEQGEKI